MMMMIIITVQVNNSVCKEELGMWILSTTFAAAPTHNSAVNRNSLQPS